jgi:hypothetical protein
MRKCSAYGDVHGRQRILGQALAGRDIQVNSQISWFMISCRPASLRPLKKAPPDTKWQRRDRLHQPLSQTIGQPHLEKQVAIVTNLMKICNDEEVFLEKFEKAFKRTFPKARQLNLFRQKKRDTDDE